jgi:hypothetical protein
VTVFHQKVEVGNGGAITLMVMWKSTRSSWGLSHGGGPWFLMGPPAAARHWSGTLLLNLEGNFCGTKPCIGSEWFTEWYEWREMRLSGVS